MRNPSRNHTCSATAHLTQTQDGWAFRLGHIKVLQWKTDRTLPWICDTDTAIETLQSPPNFWAIAWAANDMPWHILQIRLSPQDQVLSIVRQCSGRSPIHYSIANSKHILIVVEHKLAHHIYHLTPKILKHNSSSNSEFQLLRQIYCSMWVHSSFRVLIVWVESKFGQPRVRTSSIVESLHSRYTVAAVRPGGECSLEARFALS